MTELEQKDTNKSSLYLEIKIYTSKNTTEVWQGN